MTSPDLEGLFKLGAHASELGKAYKLQREGLWWPNLVTLVLPAILSTVAAIVVALPNQYLIYSVPLGSILAGSSAVLITIHKVLKCEEYQAECLRLSGAYNSITIDVESAINSSRNHSEELSRLSGKMTRLLENATATVSEKHMNLSN